MANTGAILGGGLSGAGSGAAIGSALGGPGLGTAIGAGVGLLGGLFGSNAEERRARQEMMIRAADQRAAPYLAKAGVHEQIQPYAFPADHSTDLISGAAGGFQQYQNAHNAQKQNELQDLMKMKLLSGLQPQGGKDLGLNEMALQQLLGSKLSGTSLEA